MLLTLGLGFPQSDKLLVLDVATGMLVWLLPISLIAGMIAWAFTKGANMRRKDFR
jgi:hypothetical protein